jgi:hypothetical protein
MRLSGSGQIRIPYRLIIVPLLEAMHRLLSFAYPEQDYTLTIQRGYAGRPSSRWEIEISLFDPVAGVRLGGEHFSFDPDEKQS